MIGRAPLAVSRTFPGALLRIPRRAPCPSLRELRVPYLEHTAIGSENEEWPHMSARHAGILADNPTSVGSGRFRERSQDLIVSWACLFPLPLLSMKRAVLPILTGEHDREEVALLAQLKLPLATRSKRIPPDKRTLFPAPESLRCTPFPVKD